MTQLYNSAVLPDVLSAVLPAVLGRTPTTPPEKNIGCVSKIKNSLFFAFINKSTMSLNSTKSILLKKCHVLKISLLKSCCTVLYIVCIVTMYTIHRTVQQNCEVLYK